ncbi:MAG: MFS transporter [Ottowia sp.]|uniref:MFS transporter n=1 Tax=Ottowia sp. TaxID=1898956 RepID=UPI0039E34128
MPLAEQIENAYSGIKLNKAHYYVLAMLLLGVFFDSLEQNAVGITGPVLRKYWGLTTGDIGFLNTVTFTMVALGRLLTGAIADRYGRRTLLIVNLLIFAGGSLLCALAPNYAMLAVGRGIVGFGLGGEIAVAVVMASEYFGAKQRGTAVALINVTAAGFGNMLAPAFGILVFTLFPGDDRWRWVFGLLFIPALLVIFFRRWVPETPRFLAQQGKIHEANEVISRLATGNLTQKHVEVTEYITKPDATETAHRQMVPALAPGLEGTRLDIFRGKYLRRTIVLAIGVACSYAAQFSVLTLMTTILVASGYTVNTSLWYTLVMQSGSLVGALTAAFFARRLPRKVTLSIAAAIGLTAAGVLGAMGGSTIGMIIVCGWIFNFAVIICNTTIWVFAPENYPTRIRGFGTAFILAVGSLSGGLFPMIAGRIFDAYGLASMFAMLACLFLVIGLVIQFIRETLGQPLEEEDEVLEAAR